MTDDKKPAIVVSGLSSGLVGSRSARILAMAALAVGAVSTVTFYDDHSTNTYGFGRYDLTRVNWSIPKTWRWWAGRPIFFDSGADWRHKEALRNIVNSTQQSRKDKAKNAKRYKHTQFRDAKRKIFDHYGRK